jgi:hypothetical protein
MGSKVTRALLAIVFAAALAFSGCETFKDPVPSGKPPETVGVDPSGEHIDTSDVMPTDNNQAPLVASEPPAVAVTTAPPQPSQPPPPPTEAPPPTSPQQPTQTAPDQNNTADTNSGPTPTTLPQTGGQPGVSHHVRGH